MAVGENKVLPVWVELARRPGLSLVQQRAVAERLAAAGAGELALEFFERGDVADEVRALLIQQTRSRYWATRLLTCSRATEEHVRVAARTHGPSPDFVLAAARHGFLDAAEEIAAKLTHGDAALVQVQWRTDGPESPMARALRERLLAAALADKPQVEKIQSMSGQRLEDVERQKAVFDNWRNDIWTLLEPEPELWLPLARHPEYGQTIQVVLLDQVADPSDDVLFACMPLITGEWFGDRKDVFWAGVRLAVVAERVRQLPRVREIASQDLQRVVREVLAGGWTPEAAVADGAWNAIEGFAALCDDPQLLNQAVDAVAAATLEWDKDTSKRLPQWEEQRSKAAEALTANPATPIAAVIRLLPMLSEAALRSHLGHADPAVRAAARDELTHRAQVSSQAQLQEPAFPRVPSDEELDHEPDPRAVLASFLPLLRGRAAQRDAICEQLLASRHTDPSVLRALPAARVLTSQRQAPLVVQMIVEACGDDPARWQALHAVLDPLPSVSVTFGKLIETISAARRT